MAAFEWTTRLRLWRVGVVITVALVINAFSLAHGTHQTKFRYPAQTIFLGERSDDCPYDGYHPWPSSGGNWDDMAAYRAGDGHNWFEGHLSKDRHNDGSNWAFMDGHAKWLRWDMTIQAPLPGMHNPQRFVPAQYGWQ